VQRPLLTLLLLLMASAWATTETDLPPKLFALPENNPLMTPGTELEGTFYSADGTPAELPDEGRYLLWVIDEAFALETRIEVPYAEFEPSAVDDSVLYNPTTTGLPKLLGVGEHVVIFSPFYTPPMSDAERAEAAARFEGVQVAFDENEALRARTAEGGFGGVRLAEGLYFMEGPTVRYRYPNAWTNAAYDTLIIGAAQTFLAGGEPEVAPIVAVRGSTFPEAVWRAQGPTLVLRVLGTETEAPENGIRFSTMQLPDGSSQGGAEYAHPASTTRFLLETLPPLLARYGVQGVALSLDGENREALEAQFPEWTFVFSEGPADALRWINVQAAVLDAENRVESALILVAAEETLDASLRQALAAVAQ
jgi:hypothetical protein